MSLAQRVENFKAKCSEVKQNTVRKIKGAVFVVGALALATAAEKNFNVSDHVADSVVDLIDGNGVIEFSLLKEWGASAPSGPSKEDRVALGDLMNSFQGDLSAEYQISASGDKSASYKLANKCDGDVVWKGGATPYTVVVSAGNDCIKPDSFILN